MRLDSDFILFGMCFLKLCKGNFSVSRFKSRSYQNRIIGASDMFVNYNSVFMTSVQTSSEAHGIIDDDNWFRAMA